MQGAWREREASWGRGLGGESPWPHRVCPGGCSPSGPPACRDPGTTPQSASTSIPVSPTPTVPSCVPAKAHRKERRSPSPPEPWVVGLPWPPPEGEASRVVKRDDVCALSPGCTRAGRRVCADSLHTMLHKAAARPRGVWGQHLSGRPGGSLGPCGCVRTVVVEERGQGHARPRLSGASRPPWRESLQRARVWG